MRPRAPPASRILGIAWLAATFAASGLALAAAGQTPDQIRPPTPSRHERIGINPWSTEIFLQNADVFVGRSFGAVRIELPWQQVEPQPDVFIWDELDRTIAAAQVGHVEVLLTLRAISPWGTGASPDRANAYHGASLPRDMGRWNRFVTTLADRYRGRNVAYEIENEPNSAFWAGSMDDYLRLLESTFAAITAGDPGARVVSGALACHVVVTYRNARVTAMQNRNFDTWQRAILATHAFNVIGVHDYYFPDHAVNGWSFTSYLDHIQDLARDAGCARCPLWITETGYVSRPQAAGTRTDPGSVEQQARWAEQAFGQAFEHNVERIFWLFLRDHPNAGYFASMGVLDEAGEPRPVLRAILP